MMSIVVLVVIAVVSLLVSRIASVALTATGLSRSAAQFQARSALTGVGFTTSESEAIVNHPVRRRVVMALMLIGNAGLVTAVATLLAGYVGAGAGGALMRTAVLALGLVAVYAASRSQVVDRHIARAVARLLNRYTDLDVRDYAGLLRVAGPYSVTELHVESGDWMAGRSLGELRLRDEGVVVLGIVSSGGLYAGAPGKETTVHEGDQLIVYGHDDTLAELDQRRRGSSGDAAHRRASGVHRRRRRTEEGDTAPTRPPGEGSG